MNFFEKQFIKHLVDEDNTAGAGGVFGTGESGDVESMSHGGAVGNTDFYNTNDTRVAKGGKTKKKRKDIKKHDGSLVPLVPLQRRLLSHSM